MIVSLDGKHSSKCIRSIFRNFWIFEDGVIYPLFFQYRRHIRRYTKKTSYRSITNTWCTDDTRMWYSPIARKKKGNVSMNSCFRMSKKTL